MFFNLDELVEKWKEHGITENSILQMAAVGEAVFSIWFDGTVISLKKDGTRFKQSYCNLAQLPLEEARQYAVEEGTSPKTLLGNDGEQLTVLQTNKYEGIHWRSDLCMLPEEKERLDELFRLEAEQYGKVTGVNTSLEMILDESHPWYSEPLANAVKAWIDLYSKRDGDKLDNGCRPVGGNTNLINDWLDAHLDKKNIGNTTKGHYRFIINPSKQGGPQKIPE